VRRRLDNGIYVTRYERVSAVERAYLVSMARVMRGAGPVRSGAVAAAMGKTLAELSPIRDRLIRKGVIHAPESGVLAFSVPGFRDYVVRRAGAE
jgi:hypothetical protein